MSDAVIGFLGVIVGAVVAGGVSLLGEQFTTRREREARQAVRELERKDAHDAFQREVIIAVHDAVADHWLLSLEVREQVWKAMHAPRKPTDPPIDLGPILSPIRASSSRVTAAGTKVFDDELRRLVKEISHQLEVSVIKSGQEEEEVRSACIELRRQIEERVNVLLKELF